MFLKFNYYYILKGFDAFEPIKQPGFSVRLVRKRYYTTKYYSHIVRTDPNDYLINEGDKQEASFKIVGGIPGKFHYIK